jgi:hypothetical protein
MALCVAHYHHTPGTLSLGAASCLRHGPGDQPSLMLWGRAGQAMATAAIGAPGIEV